MGVPQYRLRETFQSLAFANQLPNLLSPTLCGTHRVPSLFDTNWSTIGVTLTNQEGIAR